MQPPTPPNPHRAIAVKEAAALTARFKLKMELQKWLSGAPLYKPLAVPEEAIFHESSPKYIPALDELYLHCDKCRRGQRFRCSTDKIPTGATWLRFVCKNCDHGLVHIGVLFAELQVQKIGQFPPLQRTPPPELDSVMTDEDRSLYRNALTCRNSNFGLGAVAYLRRIVENRVNGLLEMLAADPEAHDVKPDELARVTEDRRFSEKIALAQRILPERLIRDGFNPIATLHDLTSAGLHGEPEAECTETFDKCKAAFEYVLVQLATDKKNTADYVAVMKRLTTPAERDG